VRKYRCQVWDAKRGTELIPHTQHRGSTIRPSNIGVLRMAEGGSRGAGGRELWLKSHTQSHSRRPEEGRRSGPKQTRVAQTRKKGAERGIAIHIRRNEYTRYARVRAATPTSRRKRGAGAYWTLGGCALCHETPPTASKNRGWWGGGQLKSIHQAHTRGGRRGGLGWRHKSKQNK